MGELEALRKLRETILEVHRNESCQSECRHTVWPKLLRLARTAKTSRGEWCALPDRPCRNLNPGSRFKCACKPARRKPSAVGRCRLYKGRRWCSFPWGHPGVHSWDVRVEPIHRATGKPARKRGVE